MTTSILARQPEVIIGVDAHKNTHHAVILTSNGQRIADQEFPANTRGYTDMLSWTHDHGNIQAFGVESTGSFAAGLARFLIDHRIEVREVNTPHAHTKARVGGKTTLSMLKLPPGKCLLASRALYRNEPIASSSQSGFSHSHVIRR